MTEGDIYFWRFKEDAMPEFMPYHCKSRRAVVVGGRLVDTFWSSAHDGYVIDPSRVNLEFKGNKADLRPISASEVKYYDDADVVDMRHSNASRAEVYVKAGAQRSRDAMMRHITSMIDEEESKIKCAKHRLEMLATAMASVDAGELDKVFV